MPGYLMLLPLLADTVSIQIVEGERLTRRWLLATAAATPALLAIVIVMALLPWPGTPFGRPGRNDDPLVETLEWRELRRVFRGSDWSKRSDVFVAAERWHEAGRIDYALRGSLPVTCLCEDARGYGIQAPMSKFAGFNAIVVVPSERAADAEKRLGKYFSDFEALTEIPVDHGGEPSFRLKLYVGRNFSPPR